jgi:hypothetical protein
MTACFQPFWAVSLFSGQSKDKAFSCREKRDQLSEESNRCQLGPAATEGDFWVLFLPGFTKMRPRNSLILAAATLQLPTLPHQ